MNKSIYQTMNHAYHYYFHGVFSHFQVNIEKRVLGGTAPVTCHGSKCSLGWTSWLWEMSWKEFLVLKHFAYMSQCNFTKFRLDLQTNSEGER